MTRRANSRWTTFAAQQAGWIEYLKGTAWALQDAGLRLTGWEGVLMGDVPLGAGLSSSAALEMATARAFAVAGNLDWKPAPMAMLGQRAENKWVGVNCGIMDQLISAAGRARHALLIDCRSLDTQPVPFPPGVAVAVLDTATRRGLVDSAYNERRSQCEAAARFCRVPALRDVTIEQFEKLADGLDAVTRRRARHVITENARTLQAADAMRRGDAPALGHLMGESHQSLRDDYEVSSDALNAMVQCAAAHDGMLWRADDGGRLRRLRRGTDSCRCRRGFRPLAPRPHTSRRRASLRRLTSVKPPMVRRWWGKNEGRGTRGRGIATRTDLPPQPLGFAQSIWPATARCRALDHVSMPAFADPYRSN